MVHVRYLYDRICDIHQHDTVSTVPQVNKKSTAFKDEDPFTARAPGWRQIAPNCPSSNRSSDDKSLDLGCYPFFQSNSKTKLSSCRMLQVISSLNLFMQFYIYIYIYMYDVFMHYIIIYLHTYITYHYMTVCLVTSTLFVLKSPFFLALFTFNRFHRWIGVRENLQEISWNFPWNMRFLDTFPWTRPLK